MVSYPIYVRREYYRGKDPRKRAKVASTNQTAALLETYINGQLQAQERPVQVYDYYQIAEATGVPVEVVRELCFSIDGGHNGFTAVKSGHRLNLSYDDTRRCAGLGQLCSGAMRRTSH